MSDSPSEELPEQVDSLTDDPGGMPFDDDLGDDPAESEGTRGVDYDSPKTLLARNISYPSTVPPGMVALRQFVLATWGGADLGTLSRPPRPVRGGSMPSLHNWGLAWDWRWQDPGPGRAAAEQVIAWCLQHADVLGIQGVHDYQAGRYWKSYAGWRNGKPSASTGMGQPWGQWLHLERTWAAANDPRSISEVLGGAPAAPVAAVAPPPAASGGLTLPTGPLRQGSSGADVGRMQDFLRFFGFAAFTRSDGVFGPRTDAAVRTAQEAFTAAALYDAGVDGIWGKKSAAAATAWPQHAPKQSP